MNVEDLACLRDVIEAGSLSAVAKSKSVAVSTVSRRLDSLEAELKLALLDRGRDGVTPTLQGRRVLKSALPLLAEADRLARTVDALRHDGPGEVVITATEFVVSDILAPALPRLPPGVRVDLRSQAAVVSLAGREADLAIRMSQPEGASLVARKLTTLSLGFFCSPGYLGDRDPARLVLSEERLLIYDDSYGRLPELEWVGADVRQAITARTNSTRALLTMAVADAGVAMLPSVFARRAGLVQVTSGVALPPRTPWLVVHADLKQRPDLRRVQAWITDAFKALV